MGDEQGGSYHPQALLKFDAVDFNRVDATTNGGITRIRGHPRGRPATTATASRRTCTRTSTRRSWARSATPTRPSSGASRARASTPWTIRSSSPSSATGSWTRCPTCPASARLVDPAWIAAQEQVTDPDGLLADL